MNEDCLKLTTYFSERHRTDDRFVADALVDLYGQREVEISVMLRGVEGFGAKHHLRTDRLLTLSEDLPLVSVAVDSKPRIENLLEDVISLKRHGLITLERARMLTRDIRPVTLPQDPVTLPEELHEATKLTIYVGRQQRVHGFPTFIAVCDLLHRQAVAGATALLGVDGTVHGVRQRARFFGRNADVPMMIIAVGSGEQIARVLPELGGLLAPPVLTLERVRVCKRDGQLLSSPTALPSTDEHGLAIWQKLMVYASEQAHHDHSPLHVALVRRLRASGAGGVTCVRGVWGFHGDHLPHGDRLLQLRRRVPIVTIIVDTPERIAASFEIVDELTQEAGLVTSEMVPAVAAPSDGGRVRGGLRLARHRF
jgi:PII-like signaling protein